MGKNLNIETIDNKELLENLKKYQAYSGISEEKDFISSLEKAIFLLPIKKQIDYMIDYSKQNGTPVNFLLIEEPIGKYLPAFTSLSLLRDNIKDCDIIPLTYNHLVDLSFSNHNIDGFYINPYTMNLLIDQDTMQYFSQVSKSSINNAKKITFGEPMEYPTSILSMIVDELRKNDKVVSAYFTLMQIDENIPEFLLVIEGEYDEKDLYNKIQNRVRHLLEGTTLLNITNLHSYIGKQAIDEQSVPIYKI